MYGLLKSDLAFLMMLQHPIADDSERVVKKCLFFQNWMFAICYLKKFGNILNIRLTL